jgi:hypothetical protein
MSEPDDTETSHQPANLGFQGISFSSPEPQKETGGMAFSGIGIHGSARLSVHSPLPAQHPFYALVGQVASEWAHLEHILDVIIWTMVSSVDRVTIACVTSQIMGVGPRCKVILNLCKLKNVTMELKPIRTLMGDSFTVADMRARFVHDPWYMELDSQQPSQFRAMPYSDPRYGFQEIKESDAADVLAKIRGLQEQANAVKAMVFHALSLSS